jgi:hypothetical protein
MTQVNDVAHEPLVSFLKDFLMEGSPSQSFETQVEREVCLAMDLTKRATEHLQTAETLIEKIKSIACARFSLQLTAKYLYLRHTTTLEVKEIPMCNDLFQISAKLCDLPLEHIRLFSLIFT